MNKDGTPNVNPKNFKEAALSHIPFNLIQAMEKETAIKDEDLKAYKETVIQKGPAIRASIPANQANNQVQTPANVAAIPPTQQFAFMSYAIEGHVIQVPTDTVGAAISMFYTLVAFVFSKDKRVAKILKQLDFKFYDANRVQIYPPIRKNVKK